MTSKAGLIGYPLKKSLSPRLFAIFSDKLAVSFDYNAVPIKPAAFAKQIELLKNSDLEGFNITIPFKEKIIPFLTSCTNDAKAIGAVNCVTIENSKLKGHNTDAMAITLALREASFSLKNKHCVIWGAGGAARAGLWALAQGGPASIKILNRTPQNIRELVKHFSSLFPKVAISGGPLTAKPDKKTTVFLNATPMGMYAEMPDTLLHNGPGGSIYIDFAYSPGITPFLKNRNGVIISGLDLLIYQALKSAELYGKFRLNPASLIKLKNESKNQLRFHGSKAGEPLLNIYLTGFMGSGKTTTGKLLARQLRLPFTDTDSLIQEQYGLSAGDFIATKGLRAFRKAEHAVLKNAAKRKGYVISLGGGIMPDRKRKTILADSGLSVYLECSEAELLKRLEKEINARPLLGTTIAEAKKNISLLLAHRRHNYEKADIILNTNLLNPKEAAAKLANILRIL